MHVVRCYFKFFKPRKRVKLVDCKRSKSVDTHGKPQYNRVQPAATPRSARSRAELVSYVEQVFAYFVVKLGRERTAADDAYNRP